ncbi:MAG TPA: nitroreductase family protein [Anaerolineae bacterium]|nr:nitroreductase family protein [Anaerolineae bacterium]
MLHDIAMNNRSYRRFHQDVSIARDTLVALIDLARLSASGANRQPLKYIVSSDPETNARVFPALAWAGYLTEWEGPPDGERPSAYIVILGDTEITTSFGIDHGIAAQSIMLGAVERGYGGCMIASIKKEALRKALEIPDRYEVLLVLALGKPKELVQIDPVGADGSIKYWRDAAQVHHVPKRALDEIILR